MLQIITDGAADVPAGWEQTYEFKTIPINILFGEKTFIQFEEMGFDDFYKEVESNKNFPKTSQPSPHQFGEFYKKNFQKGDTILSIHVTSKLSGTYASAVAAAQELKGAYNVIPFDSLGGSMGLDSCAAPTGKWTAPARAWTRSSAISKPSEAAPS